MRPHNKKKDKKNEVPYIRRGEKLPNASHERIAITLKPSLGIKPNRPGRSPLSVPSEKIQIAS